MRRNSIATLVAVLVVILLTACGGQKSAFDIAVGDCFNTDSEADTVSTVGDVECTEPHDSEAFYLINYPAGDDDAFPGQDELDSFSDEQCVQQFESYVGIPYDDSKYFVSYLQPTAESWAEDDREIVCLIVADAGEKLNASAKGTAE